MPTFLCVECFQCKMFQCTQLCKAGRKFKCKVCRAAQSIRKVYAKSEAAKDIRHVVMALNQQRGERREAADAALPDESNMVSAARPQLVSAAESKWASYVPDQPVAAPLTTCCRRRCRRPAAALPPLGRRASATLLPGAD